MIGQLDPSEKKAVIIGAGISGLLIAHHLKKSGYEVIIYEASNRAGGLIQTIDTNWGPVEQAAHSLMVNEILDPFFKDLNVPLQAVHEHSRARYIVRNGKPKRLPLTFFEIFTTLLCFFSKPKKTIDLNRVNLAEWCQHYLGSAAHRYLLSPFVTGIFACSPSDLLARLAFPKLIPASARVSLFQHLKSLKNKNKSKRAQMMTPEFGMSSVVHALELQLQDCIQLNHSITTIHDPRINNKKNIIWTVPAPILSKIFLETDAASADALSKVTYSPLVTVTVFISRSSFKKCPKGVGVLIPREQGFRTLGVLYNSSAFSNRVQTHDFESFTFMFGGTQDPSALQLSDAEIKTLIETEAQKLWSMDADSSSFHFHITRWPQAIPIYNQALSDAMDAIKMGYCKTPGRVVFSNYSGQVSIRGMIETLHTALKMP